MGDTGFGSQFGESFYEGGGTTTLSPYVLPVSLGGHPYDIDWTADTPLDIVTVPLIKEQQDSSSSPGEQSINPEAFWRRLRESWHLGAGQTDADREESSQYRFRDSQGIDPWDRWTMCLLNDTELRTIAGTNNQRLLVVGSRLYYVNGTSVGFYTTIGGAITNVTGYPGTAATDITSDGFNVLTCHGAANIYKTTRTTGTAASHITGTVSVLGFARGRFLAAHNNFIYDITALAVGGGGALPVALFTQPNTDFDWVGFAEGSGWIYAAGYSGDKSLIYKTAVRDDASALQQFSVAAELPDGEIVTEIYGYLGRFIAIGTDKGFRLGVVQGSGDLSLGVLIETPAPVLAFEGQGKFVWFGWGSYDTGTPSYTGLGRFSVEDFVNIDLLQPAYASDLMAAGQANNITSIVTFDDQRAFTVDGIGWYREDTDLVAEGHFRTGLITYGTNEAKVGLFMHLQHTGLGGEIEVEGAFEDEEVYVSIGVRQASEVPMSALTVGEVSASSFEFKITLRRNPLDFTDGPCLKSWLFRVQPKSDVTRIILATVYLAEEIVDSNGQHFRMDPFLELDHFTTLHESKAISIWEMAGRAYSVILEDYQVQFRDLTREGNGNTLNGNMSAALKLKRIN